MLLRDIIELRDKLKEELATVEKFLEIAKSRGVNGIHRAGKSEADGGVNVDIPNPDQRTLKMDGAQPEYGNVSDLVRQGIALCGDKYTINDVEKALRQLGKPLTKLQISSTLTRFANRTNEIQIETRGEGNKPTIYKKPNEVPQR